MVKRRKLFYLKITILCFLFLGGIFLILRLSRFISGLKYFSVEEIVTPDKEMELNYLKGRSIFSLNLKNIFDKLDEEFPDYRIINVRVQLPNRLLINAYKRKPIAYVRLYRDFALDQEGRLFRAKEFEEDLPIIVGLENKIRDIKSSKKQTIKELQLAIQLIQEFNKNQQLKNYRLRKINAETSFGLSFLMDNIEVKIGERINAGLNLLLIILSQLKPEVDKIAYIDLRFKDPVVRYEH